MTQVWPCSTKLGRWRPDVRRNRADPVLYLGRLRDDPGLGWGRTGVDLGPVWAWVGVALGTIRDSSIPGRVAAAGSMRCLIWVVAAPMWGRSGGPRPLCSACAPVREERGAPGPHGVHRLLQELLLSREGPAEGREAGQGLAVEVQGLRAATGAGRFRPSTAEFGRLQAQWGRTRPEWSQPRQI